MARIGVRAEQPAVTAAHEAAAAGMRAMHGDARKSYEDRGITAGPGELRMPGHVEPEDFGRPYISEGHAAPSPMAEAPRQSPMPPRGRGILEPFGLPGMPVIHGSGPAVDTLRVHSAKAAANLAPTPIPRGSA